MSFAAAGLAFVEMSWLLSLPDFILGGSWGLVQSDIGIMEKKMETTI